MKSGCKSLLISALALVLASAEPKPQAPMPPIPPAINPAAKSVIPGSAPVTPARTITLAAGKTLPGASDTSSAIRVRISDHHKNAIAPKEGEILLGLDLTIEPRFHFFGFIPTIRITRAVDDQDQALVQVKDEAEGKAIVAPGIAPGIVGGMVVGAPAVGIGGLAIAAPVGANHGPVSPVQYAIFRLAKGPKAARSIRELAGVATSQILKPAEEMVSIPDLPNATGKVFKGKKGGMITLNDITPEEDGTTFLQLRLTLPSGSKTVENDFVLIDENENVIRPVKKGFDLLCNDDGSGDTLTTIQLTFPKMAANPNRLTWSARQATTIDIPFTLKNISLP